MSIVAEVTRKELEERTKRMNEIKEKFGGDPEAFHSKADDLILETLEVLGFKEMVETFKSIEVWYA